MVREGAGGVAVVVVAEQVGKVLNEGATQRDVHHLHAPADAEHGHPAIEGATDEAHLEAIALGPRGAGLRVPLRAVGGRVDVGAARKHQPLDSVEQRVGRLLRGVVGRQQERKRRPLPAPTWRRTAAAS